MNPEEKDFVTTVELLKKDYFLENESNLKKSIGEIIQDFTNRGLYKSTACTGKQLEAHFDYINRLFVHIIESLKKDFAYIPLEQIKKNLLTIADEEYNKLIPFANSHLHKAGLLEQSILKSVEQVVNSNKEKTKQTIETKLALTEKQKVGDGKDLPKKDIPVFPDITPSSIRESRFRILEKGDFATDEDVQDLIMLLFSEPECEFYYFHEKGTQLDSILHAAVSRGDVRIAETIFFYYKHPKNKRGYVHIERPNGNYRWEWEKEVVQKGPMFCRSQLKLSQRKIRELEIQQIKDTLHKVKSDSPFIKAGGNISAGGDIIVGGKNKKQDAHTKGKEQTVSSETRSDKFIKKIKDHPILSVIIILGIIIIAFGTVVASLDNIFSFWNKIDHSSTESADIFAYVSKDGSILRSNNFPWKITKTKDSNGDIFYIINDRQGDSTAISVLPDNSTNKYFVRNAWSGMAIVFTCAEEEISNFTIKVKY